MLDWYTKEAASIFGYTFFFISIIVFIIIITFFLAETNML